jgi:hypothetical protein
MANAAMTKPLRSPVVGYNHNLRYRGRLFHVQSEDSGPVNPHVFTHLFFEGTILSSKKLQYDAESHEDAVRLQMQQLHKLMIRELTRGEHDPRIIAFFTARGQEAYSEPAPLRAPPAAAPAPVEGAASAEIPIQGAPAAPAPAPAPAPAQVIQVTGVVAGSIDAGPARRPAPAGTKVTPRPVVMVKPTNMKRPPMAFSASADGVVVQRNVVVSVGGPSPGPPASEPASRVRTATVVGDAGPGSPAQAMAGPPDPAASRGRAPSPGDKPFSDLVSDKSLDDVILEYLSDDNEPERR